MTLMYLTTDARWGWDFCTGLKNTQFCLFFMVPWRQMTSSERIWTSLSQLLAARNPLKWTMRANFVLFMRSYWSCCWRFRWRRVISFESVMGTTKTRFPHEAGYPDPGLCLPATHSYYRPRRTAGKKHESVRGCTVEAKLSVLNLATVEIKDKDISGLTDTTVLQCLETKRAQRQHLATPRGLQHSQHISLKEYVLKKK